MSPLTGGKVKLRTEQDSLEYRGETITYIKSFYHCVDTGFEFEDAELENNNLKTIQRLYYLSKRILANIKQIDFKVKLMIGQLRFWITMCNFLGRI